MYFFRNGYQKPPSVYISIYIVRGVIEPPIPTWICNQNVMIVLLPPPPSTNKKHIWFTDMQKHPSTYRTKRGGAILNLNRYVTNTFGCRWSDKIIFRSKMIVKLNSLWRDPHHMQNYENSWSYVNLLKCFKIFYITKNLTDKYDIFSPTFCLKQNVSETLLLDF